ncbi:MAG: hypothetical protein K6E21_05360 [Bacilli bacterium]|nr:hypothetical protein [Bacilli bacterium]
MKINRLTIIPILMGTLLGGCKEDKVEVTSVNSDNFTIRVDEKKTSLIIGSDSNFKNSNKKLISNNFPELSNIYTYSWFLNEAKGNTFDKIHSEKTDTKLGLESDNSGLCFLKYTFFIKNDDDSDVMYNMNIQLNKHSLLFKKESDEIEYLRLMVFEDDKSPVVYAHRSKTRYDATNEIYKEYISGPEGTTNYFGEAELFESDTLLATVSNNLKSGESKMYTLLFWLEGADDDLKEVPDNTFLNIDVNIC